MESSQRTNIADPRELEQTKGVCCRIYKGGGKRLREVETLKRGRERKRDGDV